MALNTTPSDITSTVDDKRIQNIEPLPPPEDLIRFFPIAGTSIETQVSDTRSAASRIIHGKDDRLIVVVGPCSVHDPAGAIEYARNLAEERKRYKDTLEIIMRVYFEKPRTTVGWKGLINDPYLDETYKIDEGLRIARQLLLEINRLGVPAGSEYLDVISPQYIADLIAWGAIGARTTESQVHRELTSGLSSPVGFKNGTDGNIKIALDAILAASKGHHFLSVHKSGKVAMVQTTGNLDCHLILRGGKNPNYSAQHVLSAAEQLMAAGLYGSRIMIDASHGNSQKNHENQLKVVDNISEQIGSGSRHIGGVMIESNLEAGAQKFTPGKDDPQGLIYGQSITDACVGWEETLKMLKTLSKSVEKRRTKM
ncbi:MAG: 3-deoxy-7-phosphoheptulonate synthase AroG [Candidatus Altimarinota bacterium]